MMIFSVTDVEHCHWSVQGNYVRFMRPLPPRLFHLEHNCHRNRESTLLSPISDYSLCKNGASVDVEYWLRDGAAGSIRNVPLFLSSCKTMSSWLWCSGLSVSTRLYSFQVSMPTQEQRYSYVAWHFLWFLLPHFATLWYHHVQSVESDVDLLSWDM